MAGLEIIVGTYEEYTVGFKVEPMETDPSCLCLKEIFSTHNHTSSVRALASHNKILASGGADDRICIFDLESGTLKDELLHHNGTINCLTFTPDGRYLLSGSQDGSVSKIDTRKLAVDKALKSKVPVMCVSIHPSGELSLSLQTDMTLRTWGLEKRINIPTPKLQDDPKYKGGINWVEWSPDGSCLALMGAHSIHVISLETTKLVRTVQCHCKPVSFCWISDTEIAVGLDDGHLLMFDYKETGEPEKMQVHESRLKAMHFVAGHLATASSGGDISLWKIEGNEFREVCTTNIGCRPTCLLLVEADRLGLHKYLIPQEDSKEKLKQELKNSCLVGRVIVEQEDAFQEADMKDIKKQKKKKRPLKFGKGQEQLNTPALKKKKKGTQADEPISPIVASLASRKLQKQNLAMSGTWVEEEVCSEKLESSKRNTEAKKFKKKSKSKSFFAPISRKMVTNKNRR